MLEINLTDSASLPEGTLRQFATPHDGPAVLLARHEGQVRAFAAHCPHYGAPLEKGRLVRGRIVCPWHHACFRVQNGHLCEPPALDDLPAFAVRETKGRIWVKVPATPPARPADADADAESTPTAEVGGVSPLPPGADAKADTRTFVIIGGGAAGQFAAQTLRREGFAGRLVLVSADEAAPYDRTKLSKAYLAGKAGKKALPLRTDAFYKRLNIELLTNTRATGLDVAQQEIELGEQSALRYDRLLLAPGGTPNRLPGLPGHDLRNVLTLRTQTDADALLEATAGARKIVIIGAGFIGMEAAGSLAAEGREVTVVAREKVPFARVLGPEIGLMFRQLHEEKGVRFATGAEVTGLVGDAGRVAAVQLKAGRQLPADVVVLGVGVRPATDFLREALRLDKDGGIVVDEYLQAAENVFVAGDVARFPLAGGGQPTRIEHWRLAQQHGRTAALNMLGRQEKFTPVPFFWTQQYGKSLRYAGHAGQWDDIRYLGDVAKQDFLAFYVLDKKVIAVAGMGRDADMIYISELLRLQQMPAVNDLAQQPDWEALTKMKLA